MNIKFNLIVFLMLLIAAFASAKEVKENFLEPYSRGNQTFSINAGLLIPLFILFPKGQPSSNDVFISLKNQLSLGGIGSLEWATFLNNRWTIGVGLAGSFAFTPQEKTHSLIPITANLTYNFLFNSFEIPVIMGAGFVVNKVDNLVYFGSIAKIGTGLFYNINAEWGFGIRAQYWLVPEIYFGDMSDNTAFGNFMDIGLSAKFHF